jgi:hypothetical protein
MECNGANYNMKMEWTVMAKFKYVILEWVVTTKCNL